jgi:metallophosphoesterase (TIGR03767 family)
MVHDFPAYPGMLDSAELGFAAAGLRVPWYAVIGNHDSLVQGNLPALPLFQQLATGRLKIVGVPFGAQQRSDLTRDLLRGSVESWKRLLDWAAAHPESPFVQLVTPDAGRRLVSHQEWIAEHFNTRGRPSGHGLTEQNLQSDTGYYTFDPAPGIHCIVLDTANPSGGASGNLDQPQFDWLEADLAAHSHLWILVFAHHTIGTMTNPLPRPNSGEPPRLGADLEALFHGYPAVAAFINGHTHSNTVIPHPNPAGGGFWEINTAAHVDFPQQSRVIELFDNADGTISIFATMVDHLAEPDAISLEPSGLAATSRELAFNDPQWGPSRGSGTPLDRNVELIVRRV